MGPGSVTEQSAAVPSRAPSVGVRVGLAVFALPTALQVLFGLYALASGEVVYGLVLLVVPLLLLTLLFVPIRESRWPLTPRRAALVGVLWLLVGLGTPVWIYGVFPLLASPVAAVPALAGALWGHVARRR